MKWMLALPMLLSAALLPMQGQKQGSDYVLHIRHLDADGRENPYIPEYT